MKKIYLSLIVTVLASFAFAQMGQLQNGTFETWTPQPVYDYTTVWGCSNQEEWQGVPTAFKSTTAHGGTYSAEIRSVAVGPAPDTIFGYFYEGTMGAMGPAGGIAYLANFTNVKFWYQCNLPQANDSVYLYIIRYTMGVPSYFGALPAIGGIQNSWAQANVTVPMGSQDQLFIGFVMGDPMNGNYCAPGSWARIDDVEMYNGTSPAVANIYDPGFESWATYSIEEPNDWFTINPLLISAGVQSTTKSTNVPTGGGTYSAKLETIQIAASGDTMPGIVSLGAIDINNMMNPFYPFVPAPYVASPTHFTGAIEYLPSNGDQASIFVQFLKNGVTVGDVSFVNNGTMGWGTFDQTVVLTDVPDSILIVAMSGDNPGSILYLDNLSMSGGNVGISEFEQLAVSVYPNPATDHFMIKADGIYSFEVVDITGKIVLSYEKVEGAMTVETADLSSGTYMIRLTSQNKTEIHQLVIE